MSGTGDARNGKWFAVPRPVPGARVRLFAFPYAGAGAAAFRTWAAGLPGDVEVAGVRYPGRESRMREPPLDDVTPLAHAAAAAVTESVSDGTPFAFYGHSLGALVAFEVARRLDAIGGPAPRHLLVSGHEAPRVPWRLPPVHDLTDDELLDHVVKLGGVPPEVAAHRELVELMIPTLRADFRIVETYRYAQAAPLACPVTALVGRDDPLVDPKGIPPWADETQGRFVAHTLPGGHFFIHEREAEVLDVVGDAVRDAA